MMKQRKWLTTHILVRAKENLKLSHVGPKDKHPMKALRQLDLVELMR